MAGIEEQQIEVNKEKFDVDMQVIRHENSDLQPDSLEWGTPGKQGCHKVYGNVLLSPIEFGKKIELIKLSSRLANNEISFEQYQIEVELFKKI